MAFGMGASFNEPPTDDQTSAPQVQIPASASVSPIANPVAALLGRKKKSPRAPQALASEIARSKRAYQSKRKFQ